MAIPVCSILQSMKNVTCRKLVIDRNKAPEKLGTFKDISLFGNYEFPTSGPNTGGVIARSLAGTGKESKKTEQQLKSLANHRWCNRCCDIRRNSQSSGNTWYI